MRRGVIFERAPSPPAAVCKPLAVLLHEVHVMQGTWHGRLLEELVLFRSPMDLCHLGAIWKRHAVTGDSTLISIDHYGVGEDHSDQLLVLTGGNNLPALVPLELGER